MSHQLIHVKMKHYDDELWFKDNEIPSYFKMGLFSRERCPLHIEVAGKGEFNVC